ncbi:hypothetical protein DPMN_157222 [Dreissena polymorpha]|uniref:Uncharacterized protein n=1 Tax=Dreissena polymorpha TaxID=45954 RepID=A0A9D4INL6_DREPO|nr:hypothetical protein DPMN_157222 [Dreissena polymorpha]
MVALGCSPEKNAPPPGGHVFQATTTIFELFHDDRTINVASRVKTRKNAIPPWRPCFPPTGTIFKLIQDIIGRYLVTKFHADRTINVASRVLRRKNAPPPDIIGTIYLTKFHEDRKKIWPLEKNTRPLAAMLFN